MNVIIFGATGNLGRYLVTEGIRSGFIISAFVRNREKWSDRSEISPQHERITLIEGDASNQQQVYEALTGCDAAIIAAGTPKDASGFAHIVDTIIT
ncbi:NAD(P)H-binding protein [uncultured Brevibacillus sp.]|uniref:NAD(P)H-binding protein n=1 Tax=uncultured Brevibacillus sp. TaxID=169970 RepID=UPI002592B745|nr:NAD(P)H-binding protein [uncultured Brevibacillus sp.]